MPRKSGHPRDGIYQRKDRPGYWGSWIDGSGRRKQRKLEASTLEQAKTLLSAEKLKADTQRTTGKAPPTEDTFDAWAKEFLKYQERRISPKVERKKISQAEYDRQQGIVEKHLKPFFGPMKLALISKKDVNDYIDSRMDVISAGTLIKESNTLKHLFSVAVSKQKILSNPAHGADVPGAPKGRVRYLTGDELGRILRSCPEWLRPIAGLAVSLGTRRGELLKVRWEDVNIARREIRLQYTKNGEERSAFINDLAMQVLTSMTAGTCKKKGLLFPDVTPAQVTVAFIRACKDAGVEDFSLHDLRHHYASMLRMNGVDLHTLQTLLGHSDLRMTGRYSHLSPSFLLSAARQLDGVLSLAPAAPEAVPEVEAKMA